MVRLEGIADVARHFVCVRLTRIAGADLNLFDFDYDLTWAAFFLNAAGKVHGRYGGRDASGPDARNSLKGLRYALEAALAAHRQDPEARPPLTTKEPDLVERYPGATRSGRGGCIHCHQVYELRHAQLKSAGKWAPELRWAYPLPENVGLALEVDRGNVVKQVRPGSPAARAGIEAGDKLLQLNGVAVACCADAQYGLHRAPGQGKVTISWQHGQQVVRGQLDLPAGWKKTDTTWRPSLRNLLPSLPLFGEDLTAAAKAKLGLKPRQLAFRQDRYVPRSAQEAGLRPGDVVIGVDEQYLEMDLTGFLEHIRRNYLAGDRITLNVLRDGRRLNLSVLLRAG